MPPSEDYIRYSLELNLFFLRIIKEHTIFAAASFPPRDRALSDQLITMKNNFEKLLGRTIELSKGLISPEVLSSGEFVTELTLPAEKATQFLTGVPIDTSITISELQLTAGTYPMERLNLFMEVSALNQEALTATNAAIAFKVTLLKGVLSCEAFSFMYPLMLEHVIREAQFYVLLLTKLLGRAVTNNLRELIELEINWNDIMEEHSKFIRGYLDPSEDALFEKANTFAKEFEKLEAESKSLVNNPERLPEVTQQSISKVTELRNFKKTATQGIISCKIRSIISPLLADHVTREANHYLRLLKSYKNI